jgi:hypothetical protein
MPAQRTRKSHGKSAAPIKITAGVLKDRHGLPTVTVDPTLVRVRPGEDVEFSVHGAAYMAVSFKNGRSPFGDELLWPAGKSAGAHPTIRVTILPHEYRTRYSYTLLFVTDDGKIVTVDPEIEVDPPRR